METSPREIEPARSRKTIRFDRFEKDGSDSVFDKSVIIGPARVGAAIPNIRASRGTPGFYIKPKRSAAGFSRPWPARLISTVPRLKSQIGRQKLTVAG